MEWQNLKFDLAKDDIEDFCNDVKNLANRLGYPEDAQVMAINANSSTCTGDTGDQCDHI